MHDPHHSVPGPVPASTLGSLPPFAVEARRALEADAGSGDMPGPPSGWELTDWRIPAELGALAGARRALAAALAHAGWHEEDADDVILAAQEALANAVVHGSGPGAHVTLRLLLSGARARIAVRDEGRRGGEASPDATSATASLPRDRGRGRPIMLALADRYAERAVGEGREVRLEFARRRAGAAPESPISRPRPARGAVLVEKRTWDGPVVARNPEHRLAALPLGADIGVSWADELIASAALARARLHREDPLSGLLVRFAEGLRHCDDWADLALTIATIQPVIDRLGSWPRPAPAGDAHPFPPAPDDECDDDALARIDTLRWLSAMAAMQALELGEGSPMALALAAAATALWEGDSDGVGWMMAAVRLSRVDPAF